MKTKRLAYLAIVAVGAIALCGCQKQNLPLKKSLDKIETPIASTSEAEKIDPLLTEEKTTEPQKTVLIFGGDVMLSRTVGQKMEKYQDYAWPFKKISSLLSSADIAVINLESPLTYSGKYFVPSGSFSFNADPRSLQGLILAGIDLAALANNHFGNQGVSGMRDTFKILQEKGIAFVGAGNTSAEAHQPALIEKNGITFSFLNYGYPEDLYVANSSTPGIANMDIAEMKKDVKLAKEKSDVVIIIMHAGIEYVNKPNSQQKEFARGAIDAGADLVIGHHPHWVQITEIYQSKPIIYSLGNLVFDQMWSTETQQGALAKVIFRDNLISSIEIIPIRIKDYGQPEIVSDEKEREVIFSRMELEDGFLIK
ncbi:MAG: Capsule biosynthesis protein CapA [Parcubacteria group bacterium ADurb.Bin326]|nr:MAG: Capsule biosynthesis protein CapA [Parcubacteria group bacterium ADurb.Bin326]